MINWRDGKGGFVGASKRFIKGFFSYSYAVTTESVEITTPGKRIITESGRDKSISISSTTRVIDISQNSKTITVN